MGPRLEVHGLSISFKRYSGLFRQRTINVVEDLHLSVNPGEIVAVFGASGAGKSLLAHAILGILPEHAQTSGSIHYEGTPLTIKRLEKLRGRDIAFVPQSVASLNPLMRVKRQLHNGMNRKVDPKQQQLALERLRIDEALCELYPHELSGGMARRVLVATALMHEPKLVIADEPTPGMQGEDVRETLLQFRMMAEKGSSVLLITHDIESALTVADRVAVLYNGTVIEQATAKDFSGDGSALRHPYTQVLWKALPSQDFTVTRGRSTEIGQRKQGKPACAFASQCHLATAACVEERPLMRDLRGGKVRCRHAT